MAQVLREREVDVLISYLPVGSEEATKYYVEQALEAGSVSSTASRSSSPVARSGARSSRSRISRSSAMTSRARLAPRSPTACSPASSPIAACSIDRTYQLNFGGNTDFMNMLERERLDSKKISKTNAVTSQLDYDVGAKNVHVGPSRLRAVARRTASGPTFASKAPPSAMCR